MNLKRRYGIVFLALMLALYMLSSCAPRVNGLKKTASFEGGTAYRTADDVYWVLNLKGTWHEMGRQYGALVKNELKAFYTEVTSDIERRGMSAEAQTAAARELVSQFSDELNELLDGMAETSGLTHDEVLRLNCGFVNLTDVLLGLNNPDSCSGIAAWNAYTPDGKLVFGRNWDINRDAMKAYMKYLSVVVFHPAEGNAFANVHPLGNVYIETGMNEYGLFLELNNGMYSDGNIYDDRESSASVLAAALTRCKTIDEAAAFLAEVPAEGSYIIQLADNKRAVSVERPTFDCRVREGDEKGLLVTFNSFVPPYPQSWEGKVAPPRDPAEDGRYDHLVDLANAERFYGKLDATAMRELMGIEYKDGGALIPETVYQVVAVPEDLCLWMRGYEYSDWQMIDLKALLTAK